MKKSDLSEQKSGSGLFIGSDPLENVRHRASASDDTDAGQDKLGDDDAADSDLSDSDSTDKGDSGDDSRDTDGKD